MQTTILLIEDWHKARNLVKGSKPKDQICKLGEEFGELCHAVARKDALATVDAIGDMVVVLTLLALQQGTTIEFCTSSAYDQIKDRRGQMVDGIFVRDDG